MYNPSSLSLFVEHFCLGCPLIGHQALSYNENRAKFSLVGYLWSRGGVLCHDAIKYLNFLLLD